MTRRYRDQTFRKSDIVRAIRAARSAGIMNPHIQIDRHGTISIVSGEPLKSSAQSEAELTPLEQWRAKRSGQS